jgi:hypothetical protein
MNTNKIFPVVLLFCVCVALIVLRRIRPAPNIKVKANEIPPKANPRMNRIQKVSKCVRLFLQYGIPLTIVAFTVLEYLAVSHKITLPKTSPASDAGSGSDFFAHAVALQLWGALGLVVYLFWYRTALKLFGFFEKGILFTAETVRCIQILGLVYIARFLVQLCFYFFVPLPNGHMLAMGINDLFAGVLISFIGWLIDEARKIREEQELTV